MPADHNRSLLETAYLLRSPANARWILYSIGQARARGAVPRALMVIAALDDHGWPESATPKTPHNNRSG